MIGFLRQVIRNPSGVIGDCEPAAFNAPIIFLAECHAAAGRPDNGQFRLEIQAAVPNVPPCAENHHPCDAVQALERGAPCRHPLQSFVGNLARCLAPALLDGKPGDRERNRGRAD